MKHKTLIALVTGGVLLVAVPGCETMQSVNSVLSSLSTEEGLSLEQMAAGLKEALKVGTGNAVQKASADGGYSRNPALKIPLPQKLQDMANVMRKTGLGGLVDTFESKMNQAAEEAATLAAPVFTDAITEMTFDDAKGILSGGDTAATDYFHGKTSDKLKALYYPLVKKKLEEVGGVKVYNNLVGAYNNLPFVEKTSFDVQNYVADEALTGLFSMLGDEEKKIRQNPAARTTELLKKVFANASSSAQ